MPMTIEQLKSDAPELLAQIQKEAADQAAASERARVVEILAADGDAEVTRKAIADGTPAGECFKLFYEAERKFRADRLAELKRDATPPQGSEEPKEEKTDQRPAHVILAEKARELAREKSIPIDEAQRLAFAQNPDLAKSWTPIKPN